MSSNICMGLVWSSLNNPWLYATVFLIHDQVFLFFPMIKQLMILVAPKRLLVLLGTLEFLLSLQPYKFMIPIVCFSPCILACWRECVRACVRACMLVHVSLIVQAKFDS